MENKFHDGMLAKMSKITDLMSKLEGLIADEGCKADDSTRCKKCLVSKKEMITWFSDHVYKTLAVLTQTVPVLV